MTIASARLSLQAFLATPEIEASPAWELINGTAYPKPMPTTDHSILQKRLTAVIDQCGSDYEAFPELRCVLSDQSVVPDITVIHRDRIPAGNTPLTGAPDWAIEILSPDQSVTKLIAKIQLCLQEGMQLGWLLDSKEQVVMVFLPENRLLLCRDSQGLPILHGMSLKLSPQTIFGWLAR